MSKLVCSLQIWSRGIQWCRNRKGAVWREEPKFVMLGVTVTQRRARVEGNEVALTEPL